MAARQEARLVDGVGGYRGRYVWGMEGRRGKRESLKSFEIPTVEPRGGGGIDYAATWLAINGS